MTTSKVREGKEREWMGRDVERERREVEEGKGRKECNGRG